MATKHVHVAVIFKICDHFCTNNACIVYTSYALPEHLSQIVSLSRLVEFIRDHSSSNKNLKDPSKHLNHACRIALEIYVLFPEIEHQTSPILRCRQYIYCIYCIFRIICDDCHKFPFIEYITIDMKNLQQYVILSLHVL